jgi:hypothetical protein
MQGNVSTYEFGLTATAIYDPQSDVDGFAKQIVFQVIQQNDLPNFNSRSLIGNEYVPQYSGLQTADYDQQEMKIM